MIHFFTAKGEDYRMSHSNSYMEFGRDIRGNKATIYRMLEEANSSHYGAYCSKGEIIFEEINITCGQKLENLFSIFEGEESIYSANIDSRLQIGSKDDMEALVNTIMDLLGCISIKQKTLAGFTLEFSDNQVYILICSGGVYHMNPNFTRGVK